MPLWLWLSVRASSEWVWTGLLWTTVEVISFLFYIRPKTFHLQLQSRCTAQPVWAQVPNRDVLSQCLCYMAPSFAHCWSLSWNCFNSNRCRGEEVCVCVCKRERWGELNRSYYLASWTQTKATNLPCLSFLPFSPSTCFSFLRKDTHTLRNTHSSMYGQIKKNNIVCCCQTVRL